MIPQPFKKKNNTRDNIIFISATNSSWCDPSITLTSPLWHANAGTKSWFKVTSVSTREGLYTTCTMFVENNLTNYNISVKMFLNFLPCSQEIGISLARWQDTHNSSTTTTQT